MNSNLLDLRNLQEQVKKAFCYQKLFWPFTVWINCFSDLKKFENSRPSASNFKSFSQSLEQFFSQNIFGNKIPLLHSSTVKGWDLYDTGTPFLHYKYSIPLRGPPLRISFLLEFPSKAPSFLSKEMRKQAHFLYSTPKWPISS